MVVMTLPRKISFLGSFSTSSEAVSWSTLRSAGLGLVACFRIGGSRCRSGPWFLWIVCIFSSMAMTTAVLQVHWSSESSRPPDGLPFTRSGRLRVRGGGSAPAFVPVTQVVWCFVDWNVICGFFAVVCTAVDTL